MATREEIKSKATDRFRGKTIAAISGACDKFKPRTQAERDGIVEGHAVCLATLWLTDHQQPFDTVRIEQLANRIVGFYDLL